MSFFQKQREDDVQLVRPAGESGPPPYEAGESDEYAHVLSRTFLQGEQVKQAGILSNKSFLQAQGNRQKMKQIARAGIEQQQTDKVAKEVVTIGGPAPDDSNRAAPAA